MFRKPGGYAEIVDPDRPTRRADTFTCGHCQRVCHVQARIRPEDVGGLCKQCMALICKHCVAKGTCTPWEKQMELMERRDRLYSAIRF